MFILLLQSCILKWKKRKEIQEEGRLKRYESKIIMVGKIFPLSQARFSSLLFLPPASSSSFSSSSIHILLQDFPTFFVWSHLFDKRREKKNCSKEKLTFFLYIWILKFIFCEGRMEISTVSSPTISFQLAFLLK